MDSEAVKSLPSLFRWLTLAALADWLITRTLTRSAIFMPKSPPVIAVYQALTVIGQLAFTLTALVALIVIGWIAFHEWPREPRARGPKTTPHLAGEVFPY